MTRHPKGHHKNGHNIQVTFINPNRCASIQEHNFQGYANDYDLTYKGCSIWGAMVNNNTTPLNRSKRHRKALAIMNSVNRRFTSFCSSVLVRMLKSSTIAQRAGHKSGRLSACNPGNSDAPFGDPDRQTT
jgi:hypothetical protein